MFRVSRRVKFLFVIGTYLAVLVGSTVPANAAFHLEYIEDDDAPTLKLRPLVPTSAIRVTFARADQRYVEHQQRLETERQATGGRINWRCVMGKESYGGKPLPCAKYCSRLQWLPSTWRAAGGTKYANLPQHTSEANEIAVANSYIAGKSRAWILGQWPTARGCGL